MAFKWKESFAIGDADIDAQHQRLFVLAHEFSEATGKAAQAHCAAQLFDYTREHFGHEEALMAATGYPEMEAHVAQHKHLIARLSEVSDRVANDSLSPEDLNKFLAAWLVGHIVTFDTKLVLAVGKLKARQQPG